MVDKAFISLSDKGLSKGMSKELCPQVLDQEHLLSAGEPQAVLPPPPHQEDTTGLAGWTAVPSTLIPVHPGLSGGHKVTLKDSMSKDMDIDR